jgi:hypothetical protein
VFSQKINRQNSNLFCTRDVHGGAAAVAVAAVYFSLPSRRGSGSFQKKKI